MKKSEDRESISGFFPSRDWASSFFFPFGGIITCLGELNLRSPKLPSWQRKHSPISPATKKESPEVSKEKIPPPRLEKPRVAVKILREEKREMTEEQKVVKVEPPETKGAPAIVPSPESAYAAETKETPGNPGDFASISPPRLPCRQRPPGSHSPLKKKEKRINKLRLRMSLPISIAGFIFIASERLPKPCNPTRR